MRDYPIYENLGPGKDHDPVTLVTLGYYVEQAGYLALVFDTHPDADNDGQWTTHIENDVNVLEFPKWLAAFERLCDGGTVEVKLPSGTMRTLEDSDDNESVAQLFGETIRDCMLAAREAGVLDPLPLAPKAFFVVEEFDGHWGWPDYEKRKALGRLRKK